MLDTQTKRRIDDCRDILVGKLPDPKAQIEQITIGLIYKFMDDMDKESIDLGGTAKFFSGDFEKYSWDSLINPKVTAAEMLALYSEAIVQMDKNPNIPQLFRDIFKNAYLPYRDPETLKLFLKTIGEFEYTHSEKLGDAFEYLLSVMGSQGDAGQFRTPRHIIDFLVAIINPDKTETILDPACGTAGFLISAYKHILLKYSKDNKQGLNIYEYNKLENKPFNNLGDLLTPDDRKKLIQNFVGYDISPDMVRLSLVNLYLHGFNTPNIHEYDTLSSEERWNESFDVVLANPPFMSPKGGIRPHKKFTISSNRSEVLFVDYIAEHLNPNGKAGIIVPEGIIFQSGTAYKDLRKMLVENHLYAVVSLPAGVFNPYSGVKTSILLMDKEVAKNREEILFIKIDNDGYNLGAQRTAVKGGQLEEAIKLAHRFVETGEFEETSIAHLVTKAELSKNGDFNLSGDRYKTQAVSNSNFELVPIEDLFETIRNGRNVEQFDEVGKYRVTRIQTISDGTVDLEKTKWTNDEVPEDYFMEEGDILLSHINSIEHLAKSAIFTGINEKVVHGTNLIRFKPNKSKVKPEFIASIFKSQKFIDTAKTFAQKAVNQASLRVGDLKSIQIPLPPLSIQEEIVAEIEGYQKIIDGAKAVVTNYKPKIDIGPDWEIVQMSEIANVNPESKDPSSLYSDWFTYIDISSVENGSGIIDYSNKVNTVDAPSRARRVVQKNDILLSTVRPNLKAFGFVDREHERFIASTGFALLRTNQKCLPKYLYYLVFQDFMLSQMVGSMEKGAYPSINQNDVNNLKVALAPLETQQQIVAQIEKEQELVNSNKELIEIFEKKIKDRIAKVWGEEKTKEETLNMAAEPQVEYAKS